jgi:hypothetical protein
VEIIGPESREYQAIHKALSQNLDSRFDFISGTNPLYVVKYQLHPGMDSLFQEDPAYDPPIPKMIDLNVVALSRWEERFLGFINDPSEVFYAAYADPGDSGHFYYGNWLSGYALQELFGVEYIHEDDPGTYFYPFIMRSQPHKYFDLGSYTDDPRPPDGFSDWGEYWFEYLVGQRWMMFKYDY